MANDLSPKPNLDETPYEAPEIQYTVEDLEDAADFLKQLDHSEAAPWGYLGDQAVVVLQKLSVIRHYLLNPSDQQRIGVHTLSEIFLHSFPEGLAIGEKRILNGAQLDSTIMELCDVLDYPYPQIVIPADIQTIMSDDEASVVIDHQDTF